MASGWIKSVFGMTLCFAVISGNKTNPAYPPIEPAQEATAMRLLTMGVADMHYCMRINDLPSN